MCYQYSKALWLFRKIWTLSSNQCIVCASWEVKRDRRPESLPIISKVWERNPESLQIIFQPLKKYRLNNVLVWFHVNQVYFPMLFDNKVKRLTKIEISLWYLPAYKLSVLLVNWNKNHRSEVDLGFLQHLRWKFFWHQLTVSR